MNEILKEIGAGQEKENIEPEKEPPKERSMKMNKAKSKTWLSYLLLY